MINDFICRFSKEKIDVSDGDFYDETHCHEVETSRFVKSHYDLQAKCDVLKSEYIVNEEYLNSRFLYKFSINGKSFYLSKNNLLNNNTFNKIINNISVKNIKDFVLLKLIKIAFKPKRVIVSKKLVSNINYVINEEV